MKEKLIIYPSEVEGLLRCSYQYKLRKIDGIYPQISMALLKGRVIHSCISNDVNAGKTLTKETLEELAKHFLNKEIEKEAGFILYEKEPALEYQDAIKEINSFLNQYIIVREKEFMKNAMLSEQEIEIEFEKYTIKSRLDILYPGGFIEFKTKKTLPKVYNPRTSLQLNIYAILLEKVLKKKSNNYICYLGQKDNTYFIHQINEEVEMKSLMILESVYNIFEKEIFIPAPQDEASSWICSYCGVAYACPYILR